MENVLRRLCSASVTLEFPPDVIRQLRTRDHPFGPEGGMVSFWTLAEELANETANTQLHSGPSFLVGSGPFP